jgi:hypothetical protein
MEEIVRFCPLPLVFVQKNFISVKKISKMKVKLYKLLLISMRFVQLPISQCLLLSQKEIKEFGTAFNPKLDRILHKLVPTHCRAHIITGLGSLNSSNFVYNESASPVSIENYYPNKNSSLFVPMSLNTLKYHDVRCLFTLIYMDEALLLIRKPLNIVKQVTIFNLNCIRLLTIVVINGEIYRRRCLYSPYDYTLILPGVEKSFFESYIEQTMFKNKIPEYKSSYDYKFETTFVLFLSVRSTLCRHNFDKSVFAKWEHFECISEKSLQIKILKNYPVKHIKEWFFYFLKSESFIDDPEQVLKMRKQLNI